MVNPIPKKRDEKEYLVDTAYEMIRSAILNNELTPGTILSETELSRQLGISRTPTREALKRLEEQDLVRIVPRKGAFVTDLSIETIHEIYQLREALECYAISFVPEYGDSEELERIYNEVLSSEEWFEDGDIDKINDLDIRLHRFIADSTHNQRLVKMINQLLDQIVRLRRMTPNFPGRLKEQREEHLRIVIALRKGDVDTARKSLCQHLRTVSETARQIRLKMWPK